MMSAAVLAESPRPLDIRAIPDAQDIVIPNLQTTPLPDQQTQNLPLHPRRFATLDGYKPKLVRAVKPTAVVRETGEKRYGYTIATPDMGSVTLLMPSETEIFPLPATSLSELNGAITYFRDRAKGTRNEGNADHSKAAEFLSKYWIDIAPCFYEEGTEFPDTLDSVAGVMFEDLEVSATETDVLGVGPDHRILNLELKKHRRSYGTQIRRQEEGIRAVLRKENGIDLEPGRVVSLVAAYSKTKLRRIIDLYVSHGSTIYESFMNQQNENNY